MNLSEPAVYLSLLVFLPALAALVLALFPRVTDDAYKLITLAVTLFVFILSLGMLVRAWCRGSTSRQAWLKCSTCSTSTGFRLSGFNT